MRRSVVDLVVEAAEELNGSLQEEIPVERREDAPLFGDEGVLDSLGLVSLVASVEEAIEDELGVQIALADEKAISHTNSPFLTIGSLAMYAERLVGEQESA